MTKNILLPLFILSFNISLAQNSSKLANYINGEVIGKSIIADSIYFNSGEISSKYFENRLLNAELIDNKFAIKNELSYPQMFRIVFASDKNIKSWRLGEFFMDSSTTYVKADYLSDECNEIDGTTFTEYSTNFIPFITSKKYDCKSNDLFMMIHQTSTKFDTLLYNYVIRHPSSYVALWNLIERFSLFGQSELRQTTLNLFSKDIKTKKPWKILMSDLKNSKIKENEKFPEISLKNYDLKPTKLLLPKAKYTLIDYWFARCRPCLDTIPELKKLYSSYKGKGFDIISVSVDETKNVPIWQTRVKEHGLVWGQYLQENSFLNNELGIKVYPTFILLDSQGKVVWRDFDLHDLDNFLTKNL